MCAMCELEYGHAKTRGASAATVDGARPIKVDLPVSRDDVGSTKEVAMWG